MAPHHPTPETPSATGLPGWYLIAYDITDRRRLLRLHRRLRRLGALPLQRSVFAWHGDATRRQQLIHILSRHLHPEEDDLRLYPIPDLHAIHFHGRHPLPSLLSATDRPHHIPLWKRLRQWFRRHTGRPIENHSDSHHNK